MAKNNMANDANSDEEHDDDKDDRNEDDSFAMIINTLLFTTNVI